MKAIPYTGETVDSGPALIDAALTLEGVSGKASDFARKIYAQESSSGRNTTTSNAGAVGGMQILPKTFASVADPGWDINNPIDNTRAGIRIAAQMLKRAGGNEKLAAAGYYGGPGGMDALASGGNRADPRNPDAPTLAQYADEVASKLLPSASAAEPSKGKRLRAIPYDPATDSSSDYARGFTGDTASAPLPPPPSSSGYASGAPKMQAQPISPYIGNAFRRGASSALSLPFLGYDLLEYPLSRIENALGANVKPSNFDAIRWYDQHVGQPLFQYKSDMPVPLDSSGKPSLVAEELGNMAGMLGASILPSGGAARGVATRAIDAGRSVAPEVAKFLAKEVGASVASGEGETMGKYAGSVVDHPALGSVLGGMTGPGLFYALAGAAERGGSAMSGVVGRMRGSEAAKAANASSAAKEFSGELSDPMVAANLQRTQEVGSQIPDFAKNVTLGRASGSPLIIAHENRLQQAPAIARKELAMSSDANSAIDRFMEKQFPSADKTLIGSGLKESNAAALERLDSQRRQATRALRAYANEQLSRTEGQSLAAGQKIVSARNDLARIAKDQSTRLYNDAYDAAAKARIRIRAQPFVDTAKSIEKESGGAFRGVPSVVTELLSKVPRDSTMSVKTLHELSKRVNAEMTTLSQAAANGNISAPTMIHYLRSLQSELRGTFQHLEDPAYGAVGKKFAEANRFYREDYAQRFKQGLGGEMMQRGRFGSSRSPDELIDKLILTPNDASGMRDYVNLMRDDPAGMQALRNGILEKFKREVVTNGNVRPAAISAFQKKYKDALDVVPAIRDEIATHASAVKALDDLRLQSIQNAKDYSNTVISSLAKTSTPEAFINKAIASPRAMEALISKAKDGNERNAITRALVEKSLSSDNPSEFIAKNIATLSKGMSKTQLEDIRTILDARKIMSRVPPPKIDTAANTEDIARRITGTGIRSWVADFRAIMMGYGSKESLGAMRGANAISHLMNKSRDQLRTDAIFDPEVASRLALYIRNPTAKNADAIHAYVMPYLVRSAELDERQMINPSPQPPYASGPSLDTQQ